MREPLPARWVELINCVDESERNRLKSELRVGGDASDADDIAPPLKN